MEESFGTPGAAARDWLITLVRRSRACRERWNGRGCPCIPFALIESKVDDSDDEESLSNFSSSSQMVWPGGKAARNFIVRCLGGEMYDLYGGCLSHSVRCCSERTSRAIFCLLQALSPAVVGFPYLLHAPRNKTKAKSTGFDRARSDMSLSFVTAEITADTVMRPCNFFTNGTDSAKAP